MQRPGLYVRRKPDGTVWQVVINHNVHDKFKTAPEYKKFRRMVEEYGAELVVKPPKRYKQRKITKDSISATNNGVKKARKKREKNQRFREALNGMDSHHPIDNIHDFGDNWE